MLNKPARDLLKIYKKIAMFFVSILALIAVILLCLDIATGGKMSLFPTYISDTLTDIFEFATEVLPMAAALILGFFLNLTLHELSHLVAGILSGYEFHSFRILNFAVAKVDGKLKYRHQVMASGYVKANFIFKKGGSELPFKLHLLSGIFMSALTMGISILLAFLVENEFLYAVFSSYAFFSLFTLILTGLPYVGRVFENDASWLLLLSKDSEACKGYFNRISINSAAEEGVSLVDMPDEWFAIDLSSKRAISEQSTLIYVSRLIYKGEFAKAIDIINILLRGDGAVGATKSMLILQLLYCNLLEGRAIDEQEVFTDEVNDLIEAMQERDISIERIMYSYHLLHTKNSEFANEYMCLFEKNALKKFNKNEAELERVLISLAWQKALGTQ